jgi:hypothetical protein
MITMQMLLADRAAALAEHDGMPVGPVHVEGAANQLQSELLAARDGQLRASPAAKAEEAAVEETGAPVADPLPKAEATPPAPAAKPVAVTDIKPEAK